ncbi:PQQ-binding-like beta-propeller repeat protein [Aporhodopirellula aestuarii]|uniref:PQQ-like beta-propeller repeat protein n=1 Tax=Aporhodopirellula aestuarii TaxID=2950107 RepID=A0ABT0U0X2_9BACT|nr:PQQ-binding-like beta-propeller repeat protein [Aporhodopirellula aestuarii]MCM2370534.1 PQQ-like beta-propeller repeat protein [Aporhodopirellula aestuarii]
MRSFLPRSILVLITWGCCTCTDADWPQFLGENRDGTSTEAGLLDAFPESGPKVVWRVPGGVGMSAVTVADNLAITTFNEAGKQVLVAFDAVNGERVWQTSLASEYKNGQGDGPRATATVADGVVYAFTGDGILSAVKLKTGQLIWRTDALQVCEATESEYGMSSSPLVAGDSVIVHVGGRDTAVAAFDSATGQLKWSSGNGPAGYSSPTLINVAGKRQIVSVTGVEALGLDPNTGAVLWTYPFKTPYACNTANPVAVNDDVFISAGENHGCVLIDVQQTGGKFEAEEHWASVDTKSVMRNEWQTSILVDGHLYGFDNVGAAGPTTHLTCLNATTGEPVWRKTRFGKGNLVLADGKLWITTMGGELVLVKVTPEGYRELGRAQLFGKTRQSLSIANGLGYIRDDREVVCINLRAG